MMLPPDPEGEHEEGRTRPQEERQTGLLKDAPGREVSLEPEGALAVPTAEPESFEARGRAAVNEVTASTETNPRDQTGAQNQTSNQSQRLSRSFLSQITLVSVISMISRISAKWTSMVKFWNGLRDVSSDIIHVFNVIGIQKPSEIKSLVESLGLISVSDLISVDKEEWTTVCVECDMSERKCYFE